MKKIICAVLCVSIFICFITSCNKVKGNEEQTSTSENESSSVYDTADKSQNNNETTNDENMIENKYVNPVFSIKGGILTKPENLALSMSKENNDYTIRYTTNGEVPSTKSKKYDEEISLFSGRKNSAVIRAAVFDKDGNIVGKVITNSYILKDSEKSTLWTISITADTSDYNRIMRNPTASIEVPSHTEMINPDGETVISQDTGLKIFGGSSRALEQKSFKIIARKTEKLGSDIYMGKGSFSYPLFEERIVRSGKNQDEILNKYDSIILRNGGNDSLQAVACDPERPNLLRDSLSNRFAAQVSETFDYANSQFAAVYVNGEYYGILDMRENMNEDYVKNVYGVNDDDVVVIKSELDTTRACKNHKYNGGGGCRYCGSWFFYETDKENTSFLNEWTALCKRAISATDAKYNSVYSEIESKIDLDSMIEYFAINLYLCNTDWPHNNVKIWKYKGSKIDGIEITDGKWRFMYRDMDFTFARYASPYLTSELNTTADVDTFYRVLGNYQNYPYPDEGETKLYADALYLQGLFNFCLKNNTFRQKFYDYCIKISNDENKNILLSLLSNTEAEISPELTSHLDRWAGTYSASYNTKTWKSANRTVKNFINSRQEYFIQHLNNAMSYYN